VLEYLGEVTVAPITRTVRDIPSEVFLSKAEGMPLDCAVNCDHLQTVSKGKVGTLITSLPPAKMAGVGRAIRFALNV
jgi:mRNA interferase MazF